MIRQMMMIEHEKIMRQRMTWVLAGAAALIAAGMVILMAVVSQLEMAGSPAASQASSQALAMATWPGALVNSLGLVSGAGIGSLLVIILAGAAVTQEYQWRTLHLWLGQGVPRPAYTLARFASLLLPLLLVAGAALAAGGLASLAATLLMHGAGDLQGLPAGTLALGLLLASYSLLPYAALAFLLGVLTRSPAAAIGIGLAYSLLFESIAGQLLVFLGGGLARLATYLPVNLAGSLMRLSQGAVDGAIAGTQNGLLLLDPIPAALGTALYTLLLLGLAAWVFQRQDLTA